MNYLAEHYDEIFKKYSQEELLRDIQNYRNGTGKLTKVLNHFFEECIYRCKSNKYKYTPMEILQDEDKMQWILEYISTKPTFYNGNEIANIKSYFRNGTRYARKVANFCPKNARDIYFRYFDGVDHSKINCLDTSAGFGSRMSAVLLNGANYCGFDPNKELFKKLQECRKFYYDENIISQKQKCALYCSGSEVYKPELNSVFDVSFTSPPYFNLETYSEDNEQSTNNYNSYSRWVHCFVKPTLTNTYKYLKIGGYLMINIKNMTNLGKETLFNDFLNLLMVMDGLEFVEIIEMKHQGKKQFFQNTNYSEDDYKGFKEPVMCFKKVK